MRRAIDFGLVWPEKGLKIFMRPHCRADEPHNSPFLYLHVFPAHQVKQSLILRRAWSNGEIEFRCDTMNQKGWMGKVFQCAQNEFLHGESFVEVTLSRYVAGSH